MKYLKTKEQIYEFFNPVLNGDYIQAPGIGNNGVTIEQPNYDITNQYCFNDMIEKPFWLENEDEVVVKQGDVQSIGTYFINGVPLSSWSAQHGGTYTGNYNKQLMQNWYYVNAIKDMLFPDGISTKLLRNKEIEYNVNNLKIIKMNPCNIGIGFNIYINFNINEDENLYFAKIEDVGITTKPKFICSEIENFDVKNKIKIIGNIWNTIINWFKAETGIYKLLTPEVLVFTELGQLKRIQQNSIIEVVFSNEEYIKIKYDNINYLIKKPLYYWFNWYFQKQ